MSWGYMYTMRVLKEQGTNFIAPREIPEKKLISEEKGAED